MSRVFIKDANLRDPLALHPGHMRVARRDAKSNVISTEGGNVSGTKLQALGSFTYLIEPVPTKRIITCLAPGAVDLSKGGKIIPHWEAREGERVLERIEEADSVAPECKSMTHERYSPWTDCVSDAGKAANVDVSGVSFLPDRISSAERAFKTAGFVEVPEARSPAAAASSSTKSSK